MSTLTRPPITLDITNRAFVYRLWAEDGTCLYVGQTKAFNPTRRIYEHRTTKAWWPEVARVDYVEVAADELDAAEDEHIKALNPVHNKSRTRNAPRPPKRKPAGRRTAVEFGAGACGYCGMPIDVSHSRGRPRRFCSDSHRVMGWRLRKAGKIAEFEREDPPRRRLIHTNGDTDD